MIEHDKQFYIDLAATNAAECETLRATLDSVQEQIEAFTKLMENRASLTSIVRDGRKIRFTFVRNDKITQCELYGTWDDDVEGWKKELFE